MPHRNHFKPHKDRPELSALLDGKAKAPPSENVEIREAFYRAFTGDAARRLRDAESLNHGR